MVPRKQSRKRNYESLRRRGPNRAPYDRVLIVCEGSKTEPQYLERLRTDLRINRQNMLVMGDGGSAPESVVQTAIDEFNADKDFDQVFCVFDKDEHAGYGGAIDRIASKVLRRRVGRNASFSAITSVPCFEYWLLLHFVDSDAPFNRAGPDSAADKVLRELVKHDAAYRKSDGTIYERTKDNLEVAIQRSRRIIERSITTGNDNPSTRVHELVLVLQSLVQL